MLNKIVSILLILTSISSCDNNNVEKSTALNNQDTLIETQNLLDSVEIQDNYADWPFVDSIIDSKYFINKIGKKATLTESLIENVHDPKITDTLRTVEWDSSYVETISNIYTKNEYINTIRIDDSLFVFKNSIKVGIPEETIFKFFKREYNISKTYKYFLVTFGDGAENYLIFYFKNKKVKYIVYSPYTG